MIGTMISRPAISRPAVSRPAIWRPAISVALREICLATLLASTACSLSLTPLLAQQGYPTAQARRSGCEGNGFFSLFVSQPAQCGPLNAQIQQARGNLDRSMSELQRAQSNTGADRESQRRSIIGALAQNDCGPQYRQPTNQGVGGFFERLFGPGTILSPPDAGPPAPSGTYRTLCVR